MKFKFKNYPVTFSLFTLNVLAMLGEMGMSVYQIGVKGLWSPTESVIKSMGAMTPGTYSYQLFTYMFLHGNLLHIFLNMLALVFLGMKVEKIWGSKQFFAIYLFSGLLAGLFVAVFSSSHSLTVGASGAIMGIVGADIFIHIYYKAYQTKKGKSYLKELIFNSILTFALGAIPQISGSGHLGGFTGGFVCVLVIHLIVRQDNIHRWRSQLI